MNTNKNLRQIGLWIAGSALLIGCQDEGNGDVQFEPDPEAIASWTGAGDGASWSDDKNWDRALASAEKIIVKDADVTVDLDVTIESDVVVAITDATVTIGVNNLFLSRGRIVLDNGAITALQGGWFQNEGSLEGIGVITVACNDGGSVPGQAAEGVSVALEECTDPCLDFDFDFAAGETVSNQYSGDFTVSAVNGNPSHPNLAIVFDSANPTGDDTDLATPGYGIGNDTALGGLVIISENGTDVNADGLVDEPDDESAGGTIVFDFSCVYKIDGLQLIDIEEFGGAQIELFNGASSVYVFNSAQLDDNSVQSLDFTNAPPADQMVVTLTGSGALDNLRICPTHAP